MLLRTKQVSKATKNILTAIQLLMGVVYFISLFLLIELNVVGYFLGFLMFGTAFFTFVIAQCDEIKNPTLEQRETTNF